MKNTQTETAKLKKVLRTLCILTIIGSACTLLMCIYLSLMNTAFILELYRPYIERAGNNPEDFYMLLEHSTSIGIIKTILSAISIIGAILMYQIKRKGLYIYAFAQLSLLAVSPIIRGQFTFKYIETSLSVAWIAMYAVIFYYISKEKKLAI